MLEASSLWRRLLVPRAPPPPASPSPLMFDLVVLCWWFWCVSGSAVVGAMQGQPCGR
jgi:hypothetical protein